MEWNPMGVEGPAIKNEYTRYIPTIIKLKNNKQDLADYLEKVFVDDIGVLDSTNLSYKSHLNVLCDKINKIKC